MAQARPSRISQARLLADLKVAAKRGDRTALSLALDQMRTLAHSPRYWEKYLHLLSSPLARLVDLLVIKQGIYRSPSWTITHTMEFGPVSIGQSKADVL